MTAPPPPRLARLILRIGLRGDLRELVTGDLNESLTADLAAGLPRRAAARRYTRLAVGSVAAHLRDRLSPRAFIDDRRDLVGRARASWLAGLSGLALDLRRARRTLATNPGYSATAILSLAVAIGANTALYGIARQLVLDPLPVPHPDELVWIYWSGGANRRVNQRNSFSSSRTGDGYIGNVTYPIFAALQHAAPDARVFGFNFLQDVDVEIAGRPAVAAGGLMASGNYFDALQPGFILGRGFGPHDDRPGAAPVAIISASLWTRVFARDRAVVGRSIRINGTPFDIIGVTSPGFHGLSSGGFLSPQTEITVPLSAQPIVAPSWASGGSLRTAENPFWICAMARVPTGTSANHVVSSLRAGLRDASARSTVFSPAEAASLDVRLVPGPRGRDSLNDPYSDALLVLTVIAGIVLLIACANVAGLMLARGAARHRDLAVRRALGAGRWRLVRTQLVESGMLAGAGALVGVALARLAGDSISSFFTTGLGAPPIDLGIDWRTGAATMAIAGGTALLMGTWPAIRLSRSPQAPASSARGFSGGVTRTPIGRAALAIQLAATVPLVIGAGLFLRTLANLDRVAPGFDPAGLVLFQLNPPHALASGSDAADLFRRVLVRLDAWPGVSSATVVENALASGWISSTSVTAGARTAPRMRLNAVGPDFFHSMDIPLVAGRAIDFRDRAGARPVVVVNRAAARVLFGDAWPIGQDVRIGSRDAQVIGLAADSVYEDLRQAPPPTVFDAFEQRGDGRSPMYVAVRTTGSIGALESALPDIISSVDPRVPVTHVTSQAEQIATATGRERLFARLLTLFGGFALALASIGLYGTTAYSVARRTSEIGLRVALGAGRGSVRWLILRQVITLAALGLVAGLPLTLFGGRLIGTMLFGVRPHDWPTMAAGAAVMLATALLAGWLPARRAAALDPLEAIRAD